MTETLREGIEGRKFKPTLFVYVGSLLALAPAAALIGFAWNYQKLLFITPVLVVILVGIEYALCGPAPELVVSKNYSKLPAGTEGSTPERGRLLIRLTRLALYPVSAGVFLASHLFRALDEPILRELLGVLLPFFLIVGIASVIEGLVIGLARSRPKRDGLHIEHDKTKEWWQ